MESQELIQIIQKLLSELHRYPLITESQASRYASVCKARIELCDVFEAVPAAVLKTVHPAWVIRRLETWPRNWIELIGCRLRKVAPDCALFMDCLKTDVSDEPISGNVQFLLNRLISGWPIMVNRRRFNAFSWSDVHFLDWKLIEKIRKSLLSQYSDRSWERIYSDAWSVFPEEVKEQSLLWMSYKQDPDTGMTFAEKVKGLESEAREEANIKPESCLALILGEDVFHE